MVLTFQSNSPELAQFKAENPEHHEWIDGARTIIYTGDDIPQNPVPDNE